MMFLKSGRPKAGMVDRAALAETEIELNPNRNWKCLHGLYFVPANVGSQSPAS